MVLLCISQYPQDKNNGLKVPAQLRVNIWLGLSAVEKKFNSFAEGTFTVFAEMVHLMSLLSSPVCVCVCVCVWRGMLTFHL